MAAPPSPRQEKSWSRFVSAGGMALTVPSDALAIWEDPSPEQEIRADRRPVDIETAVKSISGQLSL